MKSGATTLLAAILVMVFAVSQASASSITWTGAVDANWDTNTANWTGDATNFTDDGTADVTFDTSAGGTISILPNMSPRSTTVSASSGTYTFTGGPIDSGSLTKSGGGALVLGSGHTYTGKTVIAGGRLTVRNHVYAGTVSPLGAPTGADAIIDMYPGTTFQNTGPGGINSRSTYWTTDRTIHLAGTGSGTIVLQNGWNDEWACFGAIIGTGSGPRTLQLAPSGDRARIKVTGPVTDMTNDAVSLEISFTSQASAYGSVYLEGTNTFSGPITIGTSRTSRPEDVYISGSGSLGNGHYTNAIFIQNSIALNFASAVDQRLAGPIAGGGSLNVNGPGTVTLSGANSFSGATTVNGGGLVTVVGGSCSNSIVSVLSGALNVSVVDSSRQWTCQGLNYSTTDALAFRFGDTTPSAHIAPLQVNGDVALSAASPVISCSGTGLVGLASGIYPLLKWTGTLSGVLPSLTLSAGNGTLVRDDVSKTLWLNVTASAQPLTWNGGGDNIWVANEADLTKWEDANGSSVNYQESMTNGMVLGDSVVFSNAPDGVVTLNTIVYPASVVLKGSTNYTISGSGGIAGGGSLTKLGISTQTLETANTYTSPTTVQAGTLKAAVERALGAGEVFVADGATLHLTHSNAVADTVGITLSASGSTLLCDTDVSINALTFDFGANMTFTGAQGLNFLPGGTIENRDNRYWITITNSITGRPAVNIKDYRPDGGNNTYKGFIFAPDSGTQTLGAILNPDNTGNKDKSGVTLGGTTTGNSVSSIVYAGGDKYGDVNKTGTGEWTVAGDIITGSYRHSAGTLTCNGLIKADYQGFFFTAGTLAGNCTLTRNDRRGTISFPDGFVVSPGTNSVGIMTVKWGTSGNPNADQQWLKFQDGSIIDFDVGVMTNDTIHIVDGKVDLDNLVLRIADAGGSPSNDDLLPVFTYEAGVTIDMTGFSNTLTNFDVTDVPDWAGGPLSLTDNGDNTIYLKGLGPRTGMKLIIR